MQFQSTLDLSGSVSGNGSAGVRVHDLATVSFNGAVVTGDGGGTDVICNPHYPATRGSTTDIGGGSTNCIEP